MCNNIAIDFIEVRQMTPCFFKDDRIVVMAKANLLDLDRINDCFPSARYSEGWGADDRA